jgi:hypothetical protein
MSQPTKQNRTVCIITITKPSDKKGPIKIEFEFAPFNPKRFITYAFSTINSCYIFHRKHLIPYRSPIKANFAFVVIQIDSVDPTIDLKEFTKTLKQIYKEFIKGFNKEPHTI